MSKPSLRRVNNWRITAEHSDHTRRLGHSGFNGENMVGSENRVQTIISAHNLCKRYGEFITVNAIDFEVRAGECFGILGPNGAGKTTAVRMVYGFSPISDGTMRVFGMDIRTQWREIRSRIGVCQQENTLDTDLTVQENLHVFALYFNIPGRRALAKTDELLQFFALDKKREDKVSELSGGLTRRLTLARAMINEPELIILDEPTTGLDPQSRHLLWDKLQALRSKGTTLLLTTHYMEEASYLCDRLIIMDHGRILVQGPPKDLIREHVGESVIDVENPADDLRGYLREKEVGFDDLGERLIIYSPGNSEVEHAVRDRFCPATCTFRMATLEDVFLRLTGRELRE
ncbi:MAG: ABC transporter ATP-binding protein [Desulfovibrionales bacterium]